MTCPTCKGYNFVTYDYPVGHPKFGRAQPCPECNGGEKGFLVRQLQKHCRVPERFYDAHIEHFQEFGLDEIMAQAKQRRIFLTTYGPAGVGKTHLLAAVVNDSVTDGEAAIYVKWSEMLDHLRSQFRNDVKEDVDEFWNLLLEIDVLAIDEVDKARQTDFANEKLFQLIDHRYNKLKGLTLFATNKTFRTGDALVGDSPGPLESRLRESGNFIFPIGGADRRPQEQVRWLHD